MLRGGVLTGAISVHGNKAKITAKVAGIQARQGKTVTGCQRRSHKRRSTHPKPAMGALKSDSWIVVSRPSSLIVVYK